MMSLGRDLGGLLGRVGGLLGRLEANLGPPWSDSGLSWWPGWASWAVIEALDNPRDTLWPPRDPRE